MSNFFNTFVVVFFLLHCLSLSRTKTALCKQKQTASRFLIKFSSRSQFKTLSNQFLCLEISVNHSQIPGKTHRNDAVRCGLRRSIAKTTPININQQISFTVPARSVYGSAERENR
jgi:hypothetical protein